MELDFGVSVGGENASASQSQAAVASGLDDALNAPILPDVLVSVFHGRQPERKQMAAVDRIILLQVRLTFAAFHL